MKEVTGTKGTQEAVYREQTSSRDERRLERKILRRKKKEARNDENDLT